MIHRQGSGSEGGQATVELAVTLPLIGLLILAVVQAAVIGRTQLSLQSAVREAARTCSVDPSCDAQSIVSALIDGRASVSTTISADVTINASAPVDWVLPWASHLDLQLSASATMRLEPDLTDPLSP